MFDVLVLNLERRRLFMNVLRLIAGIFTATHRYRTGLWRAYPALIKDRQGATAIEYALIASLISIAIIGSLTFFSGGVSDMFNNVSNTLQSNI